jgi:ADP-dependent NAD(P)H-hydrate dehydratase / NAD(P)H-hydrate epimerase
MRLPARLLKRKLNTHKGDYGYVLVIGGSSGMTGAVRLCSMAALRMGAGLVKTAVPASLEKIVANKQLEVMSIGLADINGHLSSKAFSQIEAILNKIDVIALGCGASRDKGTQKVILKIIENIDKPMVIDADALNALAGDIKVLRKRKSQNLVLTPHLIEFSRLINKPVGVINKSRKELVKQFSLRYNLTLVLKGNKTLVSEGKQFFENTTGNPGMATAGSGDVLCGMIAGLIAQRFELFQAAKLGVYLHGLAGDIAAKEKTQTCLIASDIIEYLPKALCAALPR